MKKILLCLLLLLLNIPNSFASVHDDCFKNFEKGRNYFEAKQYEKALRHYNKIDKACCNIDPNYMKAQILGQLGRIDEAFEIINKTISTDKTSPHDYILQGELFMLQKDYKKAILAFDKAIALNKRESVARYNRAAAHIAIKKVKVKNNGDLITYSLKMNSPERPYQLPYKIEYVMPKNIEDMVVTERRLCKKIKNDLEYTLPLFKEKDELLGIAEIYLGKYDSARHSLYMANLGYSSSNKSEDVERVSSVLALLPPAQEPKISGVGILMMWILMGASLGH